MADSFSKNRPLRISTLYAFIFVLLLLVACNKQSSKQANDWPELGPAEKIEPGIAFHQVTIRGAKSSMRIWLYLPDNPAQEKLPCILIAPAGSRLFHGMSLGEGDRPEHLPYVREGFIVAAYELDGPLADSPDDDEIIAAARAFKEADAGVANSSTTLDYLLAKVPAIDRDRIYTAGHSSAATVSLLVAAHNPRVKACVAYAPACDVVGRVGEQLIDILSSDIPGYREFIRRSSPDHMANDLRCPIFLFHADDDSVVPTSEVTSFAETLKKTNSNLTYVRVSRGDHYDSMIDEGIPKAIEWLKGL
ncbi:MAG: prolyl oligopeptidase family serine peptidase [Blastocatellia bacterium]|nr:prolyl oligopeptidase family serine peptidase [Blastocatellia bacterium]